MQAKPGVIQLLNGLLHLELTAVHQYLLHAEEFGNWGYERLHHKIADEVNDELGHARRLTRRILFLEGAPNVQDIGAVHPGGTADEMLRLDLDVERTANEALNRAIEQCRSVGDNGTVEILEDILEDTEEHRHWLESQLQVIGQVGLQNYLSEQIKKSS